MAVNNQKITDRYAIYNGDCCEVMKSMPDESMHMAVFSPPFADLYCYSDSPNDLGNCESHEAFLSHFRFVADELARIMKPGRICVVHCMDLPAFKERDGFEGMKDFSGDLIRIFLSSGFQYHSRHLIWKDPLVEATRTKSHGLMHKQLCKDSCRSRSGLPDYILGFRAPGENTIPVSHDEGLTKYAGKADPGGEGIKRSHNIWRAYASPVWMDIRQTNTLNAKPGRDIDDEKHICPLQLDTIERALTLWSNPGENIFTPFMGVGSEVYGAVINGRRGVGIELKESYYRQACANVESAVNAGTEATLL